MNSFTLYVFMLSVQSYAILPLERNPFDTERLCEIMAFVINESKMTNVGPYAFRVGSAVCHEELVQQ
jgi:hypothetical protein